jgi:hypothetical protein
MADAEAQRIEIGGQAERRERRQAMAAIEADLLEGRDLPDQRQQRDG